MTSTTFFYCCINEDGETRHQHKVSGVWSLADDWEARTLAQYAADDYHSNHDGWESSWPMTFALYATEDGAESDRFSVDCEAVPRFTASKIGSRQATCLDDADLSHL